MTAIGLLWTLTCVSLGLLFLTLLKKPSKEQQRKQQEKQEKQELEHIFDWIDRKDGGKK